MSNVIRLNVRRQISAQLAEIRVRRIEDARERLKNMHRTAQDDAVSDRPLNETLARNLGHLVTTRASGKPAQLKLIRDVFRQWQKEQDPDAVREADYLLKKRARWISLDEEKKAKSADFASAGAGFVKLAELIAAEAPLPGRPSKQENERDALLTLLFGTVLDPNPAGSPRSSLSSHAALANLLDDMRTAIVQTVPELTWYFRVVSDGGLFHDDLKLTGNGNHFEWDYSSFKEDQWSNLRPRMLAHRADIAEEGARIAGVLPNVPLATITVRSFHPAKACGNLEEFQRYVASGGHQNLEVVALDWTWRLHLVLAPVGGLEAADVQFCLIGTPGDDNPLLGLEGWQWLPSSETGGHAIDLGPLMDEQIARLMSLDSQLWLESSTDGRWILAELEGDHDDPPDSGPSEHLDCRSYVSITSEFVWSPVGPSSKLPPKATVTGLLARHVLTAPPADQLETRLLQDVQRRIAVLKTDLNQEGGR